MSGEHAIVLLSGGLDSSTALAVASQRDGMCCHTVSFDYGQRHRAELDAAARISAAAGAASHRVIAVDIGSLGGSALTDASIAVPTGVGSVGRAEIPVTYVPARNTVFLALALAAAETLDARAIYIGVNAVDYSGYPDCRPEYIAAFQAMADLATRAGVEGRGPLLRAPLVSMSKADIIRTAAELGVDLAETVSCYQADDSGRACAKCDACRLRREGFTAAGLPDPTRYA